MPEIQRSCAGSQPRRGARQIALVMYLIPFIILPSPHLAEYPTKTIHPAEVFVRICLNEKKSVFNFDPVRHEILIASSYSDGLGKDFMEKVLKKVKKQAIKGIPHFQKILTKCRKLKTLSDEEMETEYQADLKAFEEKNGYKYGA